MAEEVKQFNGDVMIKSSVLSIFKAVVGPVMYEKVFMYRHLKYWPDFKNPKTFNEKVGRRKLYHTVPDAAVLADKYAMRAVVESRLGKGYLPKLYAVYDVPEDLDFRKLPKRCVVKTNNGSGGVILIDDKAKFSKEEIVRRLCKEWNSSVGDRTNEYWYNEMKPRVVVEEFLDDGDGEVPPDYKFFCYHGKAKFIQHDHERFIRHAIRYYTEKWEPMEAKLRFPLAPVVKMPPRYKEMKALAEKLAEGYDFMRIDLYTMKAGIFVGEITLTPNAGWERFERYEDDVLFGKYW